jgi:hypothetical protein
LPAYGLIPALRPEFIFYRSSIKNLVTYYQETDVGVSFYVTEDNQEFKNTGLYKLISTVLRKPELQCVAKKKNASDDD